MPVVVSAELVQDLEIRNILKALVLAQKAGRYAVKRFWKNNPESERLCRDYTICGVQNHYKASVFFYPPVSHLL